MTRPLTSSKPADERPDTPEDRRSEFLEDVYEGRREISYSN
jgi:hypothetical protein